jgi:TIR domain
MEHYRLDVREIVFTSNWFLYKARHSEEVNTMGDIRLFVSHSHDDKQIAAALIDVIEATMVPRERILCTSHDNPKYREPEGVDVSGYLRDHLTQSSCVLGLLTPNSMKSPWCLFELGGAWAMAKQTYPLLAGGLLPENLPAALKGTDAAQLSEANEIRRVLANVRRTLGWNERVKGSAANELDALVNLVRRSWVAGLLQRDE